MPHAPLRYSEQWPFHTQFATFLETFVGSLAASPDFSIDSYVVKCVSTSM